MEDRTFLETVARGTPLWPLEVYRMAGTERPIEVACHWQHEVEILIVREGRLVVESAGELCEAQAGDIVFINAGALHRMHTPAAPYRYHALVFPWEILHFAQCDKVQSDYLTPLEKGALRLPFLLPREAPCRPAVWAALCELDEQDSARAPAGELAAKGLLLQTLAMLAAGGLLRAAPAAGRAQDGRVKEMLCYIGEHYAERLTLEQMARVFSLSPKYFSRTFREHVGMPFVAYLNQIRVEHACALLAGTDSAVLDIAYSVGFGHFSYFIKTFKAATGHTPTQYRRLGAPAEPVHRVLLAYDRNR